MAFLTWTLKSPMKGIFNRQYPAPQIFDVKARGAVSPIHL